ncbi:hypothetical protein DXG01_015265, partial [Tephrocybe rancida]
MRAHKPDPQTTHAEPTPRMHTTPDPRTTHAMRAHNPGPTNDARQHKRRTPAPRTPSTPNRTYPPPAAHCPPPIFGGRWA